MEHIATLSGSSMLLHSDARNKQCTQYAFASGRASRAKNKEGMSANFKLGSKHRILPLPDTSSRQGAQTVVIVYGPLKAGCSKPQFVSMMDCSR